MQEESKSQIKCVYLTLTSWYVVYAHTLIGKGGKQDIKFL